ncbi:tRNA-dihydrouridine synthase family protein [Desulfoluna sp.]|uniref:tRNA dihydrouridine synthase n=1 Tax=Desulfoluna sp. TaxID=2045199 RepID=UPI002615E931|nr:tRNA-dihydrouridine synthase family protein [Desulfoluna sp.]
MTHRLWLAPMQGYTELLFRDVYAEIFTGIDQAISPFISALPQGRSKEREWNDVLLGANTKMPVIPQIMGNVAEDLTLLANRLYDLGHPVVNLNLGCPFKMVAKKKKGSGMLCFPDELDALLDILCSGMKGRLSIKTRLGRHTRDEFPALVSIYNRYPLEDLTVHPRTGVQMYAGVPDLDFFEAILPEIHHRVIYNGDLWSLPRFRALSTRFPSLSDWMIGRWVIPNPFLPGEIKGLHFDPEEKLALLKRFHDAIYERQVARLDGPGHVTSVMKAFWVYFQDAFEEGARLFKPLRRLSDPVVYEAAVEQIFASRPTVADFNG